MRGLNSGHCRSSCRCASLALASANLIRSQLFGLNPHDPWTLIGAAFSRHRSQHCRLHSGFARELRGSNNSSSAGIRPEVEIRRFYCRAKSSASERRSEFNCCQISEYQTEISPSALRLDECVGLFTSTHNEDPPCGDWFVTGGIRLPFLPTRWSATHTPNPSNSRRVRAAAYSSRIAVTGFRRIARCAGR